MKASDHDLEQLFKVEQGHSVAATCRAVYDKGWADCVQHIFVKGETSESDEQDLPDTSGEAGLTMADHANRLLAAAHAADSEGGDL